MEEIKNKKTHEMHFDALKGMLAMYHQNQDLMEDYLDILVQLKNHLEEEYDLTSEESIALLRVLSP